MEHIYTLYSVINKCKLNTQSRFACFVDGKKSFNTVSRECRWCNLLTLGIKGKMFHAVESLHNNVRCAVKVNDVITPFSGRLSWGEVGVSSLANTFCYIRGLSQLIMYLSYNARPCIRNSVKFT